MNTNDFRAAARAVTDPVTLSYTRREAEHLLQFLYARARRYDSPLAMVVVRVESLPRIAALFGQACADAVLAALAAHATAVLRGSDLAARWGQSSLALLLPGTPAGHAHALAGRLREAIGAGVFAGFGGLDCSTGVSDSRQCRSATELAIVAAALAGEPPLVAPPHRKETPWTS